MNYRFAIGFVKVGTKAYSDWSSYNEDLSDFLAGIKLLLDDLAKLGITNARITIEASA